MQNYIGQVKENTHGQKFKIVDKAKGQYRFTLEFLETGYKTTVHGSSITDRTRTVKDKLSPSRYGVGIIGYGIPKYNKKEYGLWTELLKRCYDEHYHKYKNYGAVGVTMSDRWLRFDYFLEELPKVKGFEEALWEDSMIRLVHNDDVFSLETAEFVLNRETMRRRTGKRLRPFVGFDGEKKHYGLDGLIPFAKEHGLTYSSINRCLQGKLSAHKGWTFTYLEEEEYEALCQNAKHDEEKVK